MIGRRICVYIKHGTLCVSHVVVLASLCVSLKLEFAVDVL